jgi:hypothetical protein
VLDIVDTDDNDNDYPNDSNVDVLLGRQEGNKELCSPTKLPLRTIEKSESFKQGEEVEVGNGETGVIGGFGIPVRRMNAVSYGRRNSRGRLCRITYYLFLF